MQHRVLIVDDDDSFRKVLTRWLQRFDYDTVAVASAEEALQVCAEQHFSALTLDYEMTGMTGIEAIPQIRSLLPEVRILMITGYDALIPPLKAAGPDLVLKKPAPLAEIQKHLETLLSP